MKGIERESERESKILVKSSKPRIKAQTKVDYKNYDVQLSAEIMRRNYYTKLLPSKLCRRKCGNYRDTGVSKNLSILDLSTLAKLLDFKYLSYLSFKEVFVPSKNKVYLDKKKKQCSNLALY